MLGRDRPEATSPSGPETRERDIADCATEYGSNLSYYAPYWRRLGCIAKTDAKECVWNYGNAFG